jgi:predicted GIY-YIG superfamily endonuclease
MVFCEGADDLPSIMQFDGLDRTETLKSAKETLGKISGIYCIKCQETGAMYIGSSGNLYSRLYHHVMNRSSNAHLQFAIKKYGLACFVFLVVEYCVHSDLLSREQYWLYWLFDLPAPLRYNFLPTAGSSLGAKRSKNSEEHIAKISAAMNVSVSVYTLDNVLVQTFASQKLAAKWIGLSSPIISRAIKLGHIVNRKFIVRKSEFHN